MQNRPESKYVTVLNKKTSHTVVVERRKREREREIEGGRERVLDSKRIEKRLFHCQK